MIGEKALGEKLAKRLDEYALAWSNSANVPTATPAERNRALIIGDVLRTVATVIRDVTQ